MLNDASQTFADALIARGIDLRPADQSYLEEPRGKYQGRPSFVARPKTTDQVTEIVRLAGHERVGLLPYGGGTGLVGGQVSLDGPVPLIVSLEMMSTIRDVFPSENTLVAEAGAILADIHAKAEEANRLFPLSYASQGSARIGGALAVNSGGLNVLRYGMARDLCLGIEAVLPDGQVFHGLKRLRKDNTGYDLRHLLIGSEGTLGIITAAALKLVPRPTNRATAFITVPDPTAALSLLSLFQEHAGETISAFELLAGTSFDFLSDAFPDMRQPFEPRPDWCILVELGAGPGVETEDLLLQSFEAALERGIATDGAIAQSDSQRAAFWQLRESLPLANKAIGAVASHDISLPLSEIPQFLKDGEAAFGDIVRINAFGHLGDGNLHYNFFPLKGEKREDFMGRASALTAKLHDMAAARGGSFSAEHGLGRAKTADLERYGDPAKLTTMRTIKKALDPLGIMNPGAVLR
ncbi:MAG: FAD-binding oxidoreductase [Paracoccaceae bacterium]